MSSSNLPSLTWLGTGRQLDSADLDQQVKTVLVDRVFDHLPIDDVIAAHPFDPEALAGRRYAEEWPEMRAPGGPADGDSLRVGKLVLDGEMHVGEGGMQHLDFRFFTCGAECRAMRRDGEEEVGRDELLD